MSARRAAMAWFVCFTLSLLGCGNEQRARTLLFAVDGLEWSVVLPLVEAGGMPFFADLMARGSYGKLVTTRPTVSPIIWTTIATGRRPAVHGIGGFEREAEQGPTLLGSRDRRAKAFWNILSERGLWVGVVGWWLTYPVEAVTGVMVAQTNTMFREDVRAGRGIRKGALIVGRDQQVHPREREEEFFAIVRDVGHRLPELEHDLFGPAAMNADPQIANLVRASRWALRADAVYAEIGRRLAGEDGDLLAVYFGGTDVVGHRFWRYYQPTAFDDPPSAEAVAHAGGTIEAYYRYVDGLMGSILAEAGENVRVIVVSDHGMKAVRVDAPFPPDARGRELVSGGHDDAPPGVFVAAGPGIAARGETNPRLDGLPVVGSTFDVLPTLLALLELPRGRDMPGRPMPGVLEPAVLARLPPAIPSYDTEAWRREREQLARQAPVQLDAERREQLRELGYLE